MSDQKSESVEEIIRTIVDAGYQFKLVSDCDDVHPRRYHATVWNEPNLNDPDQVAYRAGSHNGPTEALQNAFRKAQSS